MTDQTTETPTTPENETPAQAAPRDPNIAEQLGRNPYLATFARAIGDELAWIAAQVHGTEGEGLTVHDKAALVCCAADLKLKATMAAVCAQVDAATAMLHMPPEVAGGAAPKAALDDALARMRRQRGGK